MYVHQLYRSIPVMVSRHPSTGSIWKNEATIHVLLALAIHGDIGRSRQGDCSMEQATTRLRGKMGQDVGATGALPQQRDMLRVTTKGCDILLHPLQCQLLICDAQISATSSWINLSQFTQGQVAKNAQAIVHGHQHTVTLPHQVLNRTIEFYRAHDVRTTINPNNDW